MADEISDVRLFVAVVAAGNLSAAARALASSPAVMSRRLSALEARLGVRLITRTTRRFELTEEGALFHERCRRIVTEVEEAEAEASQGASQPRGHLHVSAPVQWGRRVLGPVVAAFCAAHPGVSVRLTLTDASPEVLEDGIDLVLRVGAPDRAVAVVRKVAAGRRLVVASPTYLARHGTPQRPEDLLAHDCIRLVRGRTVFDRWEFREGAETRHVQVAGRLTTSSGEMVTDWARAGRGVALEAEWDIADDLTAGRLVPLLQDHWCDVIEVHACHAGRQHLPPRIKLFLDAVAVAVGSPSS